MGEAIYETIMALIYVGIVMGCFWLVFKGFKKLTDAMHESIGSKPHTD